MILAGDIGGTKTVLALFPLTPAGQTLNSPLYKKTYSSDDYSSLTAIVLDFLAETKAVPVCASFGVAGPVVEGVAHVTNLLWTIDTAELKAALALEAIFLLNDLVAVANAVPFLADDQLVTVNEGQADLTGPIAVIAPGTGLGEAFLIHDGRRYVAFPSEGGHASFSPVNQIQRALMNHMEGQYDHISFERVCSGKGIPNLYTFFRDSGRYREPAWLKEKLAATQDWTPIIVNTAKEGKVELCVATLDLFIDILANETSNLGVRLLSTGGIYLGGGIPPRLIPELTDGDFMRRYRAKGRFSELVGQIPIYIIKNPLAALHGATHFGLNALSD